MVTYECPKHHKILKESKFNDGFYCPEKVDGKWCGYKTDKDGQEITQKPKSSQDMDRIITALGVIYKQNEEILKLLKPSK